MQAALLVTDQSPARLAREWRTKVADAVECPCHEVDAHNVVPVRQQLSFSARLWRLFCVIVFPHLHATTARLHTLAMNRRNCIARARVDPCLRGIY